MSRTSEVQHDRASQADLRGSSALGLALARRVSSWALAGALAGSLLLSAPAVAAGKVASKPRPAAGAAKSPKASTTHKVSPYVRAARERSLAAKPGHQPKLRLGVRGAQNARGR